jgi:uncharacterized protein (DUF1778 family)
MPYIQVKLDAEADALIKQAAKLARRSKREQLAFGAIEHARSLLPNFKPTPKRPAKKGGK